MGRNTNKFKALINAKFEMENLGDCQYLLGMRLTRDRVNRTVTLTQDKYISHILSEYGMVDCNPVSTPMTPQTHLVPASEEELEAFQKSGESYRRAVGLLIHLVQCTRPDLAFAISQLAQFLDCPGMNHWIAFKRVLRYLHHTSRLGLRLSGKPIELVIYTDSDYAGCPFSRRSVSSYCSLIAGGCVSWRSRKQPTVATSSTEAEYRAAYEGGQETVWLRRLLTDLGYPPTSPTTLLCDNQGAIALQKNPLFQSRSKHFENKYHWIRGKVSDSTLVPVYIPTSDMLADFLTKSLPRPKHAFCGEHLNLTMLASGGGS